MIVVMKMSGRPSSRFAAVLSAGVLAMFAAVGTAQASTMVWSLDESNGCGTGCTTGPFGTVSVSDDLANTLSFDVMLLGSYQFVGGSNAFAFSLTGGPTVAFANFDPAFDDQGTAGVHDDTGFQEGNTVAANFSMDGFGKFMYGIDAAGSGGGDPQGQSLAFDVTAVGLTLASLITNGVEGGGYLFAADICPAAGCGDGLTGYAGGGPEIPPGGPGIVPLPAALPLLGTALGAMGLIGWRRRRNGPGAV